MYLTTPRKLHDAIVAPATGMAMHDTEYRNNQQHVIEFAGTCASFVAQPEVSIDGQTWYAYDGEISEKGLTWISITTPYFRVNILAIAGGTLSVKVA